MNEVTTLNLPPAAGSLARFDLRRWCDGPTLLRMVFEEVTCWCATHPAPPAIAEQGQDLPGPMLLTLLTYCYSTGRHGSEQIVECIETDATVRYLCANRYPTWHALRRFRRANRMAVRGCLAGLLRRVCSSVPGAAASLVAVSGERPLGQGDTGAAAGTDGLSRAAEALVELAIRADSAALDL